MRDLLHGGLKAYSARALLIAAGVSSALHMILALSMPRWGGGGGIPLMRRPPMLVRMEMIRTVARTTRFAPPESRPRGIIAGDKRTASSSGGEAASSPAGNTPLSVRPAIPVVTALSGGTEFPPIGRMDGMGLSGVQTGVGEDGDGGDIDLSQAPGGDSALEMWEVEELPRQVGFASPTYPEAARRLGIEGSVLVRYLLGSDGRVEQVIAVAGPELLREASLKAVARFVYDPVRQEGKARKIWMRQVITFRLE